MHGFEGVAHGHSHRTGAATRYWRDPKAISITVLIFVVLLFLNFAFNSEKHQEVKENFLPDDVKIVIWSEGPFETKVEGAFVRVFPNIETSCEFRNQTIKNLYSDEFDKPIFTKCQTLECVWTLNELLIGIENVFHFVDAKSPSDVRMFPYSSNRKIYHTDADIATIARNAVKKMTEDPNTLLIRNKSLKIADKLTLSNMERAFPCKRFPSSAAFPRNPQNCKNPGDRSCDKNCLGNWYFRGDLQQCVSGSPCSSLTAYACVDNELFSKCKQDCLELFEIDIRKEKTRDQTVAIALLTLFGLGFVLGLLFAKLYWVDPLLTVNEYLKNQHHHEHGHNHNAH